MKYDYILSSYLSAICFFTTLAYSMTSQMNAEKFIGLLTGFLLGIIFPYYISENKIKNIF